MSYYYRFPGPYLFGTDTRGNTAQTREMANWMRANVPAGSHVVTDRYTGEIVTGLTADYVPAPNQSAAYGIYDSGGEPSANLRSFLRNNDFRYFVLDTHIYDELPAGGFFSGYKGYTESINVDSAEGHRLRFVRATRLLRGLVPRVSDQPVNRRATDPAGVRPVSSRPRRRRTARGCACAAPRWARPYSACGDLHAESSAERPRRCRSYDSNHSLESRSFPGC